MSEGDAAEPNASDAEKAILDRLERLQRHPEQNFGENTQAAKRDKQWSSSFRNVSADRKVELLFAAILMLATVANGIIAARQWGVANRQAGIMDTQTKIAGNAAVISGRQADIMDAQRALLRTQADISEAVQRAFINVSELRQEEIPGVQDRIRLTPIIKNTGITAARNVTVIVVNPNYAALIRDRTMPPQMANFFDWKMGAPRDPETLFDLPDVLFKLPNLSIGPGGTLTASEISSDVVANIGMAASSNQTGRFLYGLVRYDDIFSKNHTSKFCFRLDDFVTGRSEFLQSICRHWNCTDDDCEKDREAYSAEAPSALAEARRHMEETQRLQPPSAVPATTPDAPPKP